MDDRSSGQFILTPGVTRVQCGALCWRTVGKAVEVLLVSSRDTGRWVIPKGWPIAGLSAAASAAQEAWEEAGVQGTVSDKCIGLYSYDKLMGKDPAIPCLVEVYPLNVSRLRDRYPESRQRRRKWFAPERAATKVVEPELRLLLASFVPPAAPPGDAAQSGPPGG